VDRSRCFPCRWVERSSILSTGKPSPISLSPSTPLMASSSKGLSDLHGNVPDRSGIVLLLIDVLNDFDFPNNEYLLEQSRGLAERIRALKRRCKSLGIPAIYVNDNRGRWRSDLKEVLRQVLRDDAPGRGFARKLTPDPNDYVVLKPKHSAFFATPLELILQHVGAHTTIVAGLTTNACVLVSAGELFLREYRLFVPSDVVAALDPESQEEALKLIRENYKADTTPSSELDLESLARKDIRRAA
jgi:nicotinamidase-related amidase